MSVVSASCYELLGVPVHASRSEVARAWSDRRVSLRDGALSPEQTEALCARLDEAFSILSDPEQSKRYRAYIAQRRGESAPIDPTAFLHPIVAEWSAKSTSIPAPAAAAPEGVAPSEALEIPSEPPPWLADRPGDSPAPAGAAWEVEPPVSPETPEADLVEELVNEWGEDLDERELARTVPMGQAAVRPPVADLSSLTRLTGRRSVTAMPPVRTLPGTSLPTAPAAEPGQDRPGNAPGSDDELV